MYGDAAMAPKTERIELRLEPEIIERLDEWRMSQGDLPTRSEAIRRLLYDKLEEHTKEGFRLNNADKLTIWMLSEILKNQIKERADQRKAADRGGTKPCRLDQAG